MVQRGESSRFTLEARQTVAVLGKERRQDLERDLAVEARVAGPVHLAHPALANLGQDWVCADPVAGGKRHRSGYPAWVKHTRWREHDG